MNDDDPDKPDVPPEQSVYLVVNRQIIPLKKNVTRLGRQFENDIVFHEDFLSRFHAEIHYEDGKYVLYDLDSTSGTFVNSRKIDNCVLNSGDLISLANVQIMFVNNNPVLAGKSRGMTQSLDKKTDSKTSAKHG
jgi:pSer/pThr/pTyr-binding forkhead associated (FHA) protein